MIRRVLYETVLVLLIAFILAAGSYTLHSEELPLLAPVPVAIKDNENDLFKPISIDEAEKLYTAGAALFADARSAKEYLAGHIRGAIHLDPSEFDLWADAVMENNAPSQIIITYCDGAQCPLSRDLAEKLTWLGFEKVYYLADGWNQWQAHQLPISASN